MGFTGYVLRVGGDFMYARMLIPATPFFFILLEPGLHRLLPERLSLQALAGAVAVAALVLTPHPVPGNQEVHGIVNERAVYPPEECAAARRRGVMLSSYFTGLPVRLAFLGSEAQLVYYARPAVAIESETGLTDRFIARQTLKQRGRVGHEMHAPFAYLVGQRKADLVLHVHAPELLGLKSEIPPAGIGLGETGGWILHWDPELMAALKRRGAVFEDFPARLDSLIAILPTLPTTRCVCSTT